MLLLENLAYLMTAAGNILAILTFLRWTQLTVLNNIKPITLTPPDPVPLFDVPSVHFQDIYDGDIVELTARLNRTEAAVVLFYAPWSRSSLHFIPIFERLAWKHARQNFEFVAINCWQPGAGTCRQAFSLKGGYPYLSFFTHMTGHIFYTGVLSESEIVFFIYKFTYPFHSAADNTTLAGLRMLSPSSILIIIPTNHNSTNSKAPGSEDLLPRSFVSQSRLLPQSSHVNANPTISVELYKVGVRSVMAGAFSVLVPSSLFPNMRLKMPQFFMPSGAFSALPLNWTGWLPPLKPQKLKLPLNSSTASSSSSSADSDTEPFPISSSVDRAVVAVVNSFLPATGPQFCNPGVALLKAASWLHGNCNASSIESLLAEITIGLTIEEQQCQLLRKLSRGITQFPPVSFPMLQDGGAELAKLSEIAGLGCASSYQYDGKRDFLRTSFVAVEHHAGVGVIFNHSASPSTMHHFGPRKPLKLEPAIYLLDGRQESPVKIINASSDPDSVSHLVGWLKEKYHTGSSYVVAPSNDNDDAVNNKPSSPCTSNSVRLPNWIPCTQSPTLVYYEAPWCVFCSVLTPRVVLAARSLKRAVATFQFHRVTDVDQVAEPSRYSTASPNVDAAATSTSVFSVPHYPALVLYPHGTVHHSASSIAIPHSPGSGIVPAVWQYLPLSDKLLACISSASLFTSSSSSSSPLSCVKRQWSGVRSLQRKLWRRQDELADGGFEDLLVGCRPKRLQLLRLLSRVDAMIGAYFTDAPPSNWLRFGAVFRHLAKELDRFTALQMMTTTFRDNYSCL